MIKYVFMNYWEGYQKCILNALQNEDNIYTFKPINNNIERKLISWHNSWRLNRKIELPFKILWIKRCMKDIDVSQNDEIFFVLYESFHMTYSISFLKYLHKKYKKAKFVYMFSNPVDEYNKSKLTYISNYIDMVITFNEKDAEKNGYFYFPNQPYQVPVYECESRSDLFFIGADKGRLDKLLSVYEKVSREGYKCEFYIVGVPKEKQVEKRLKILK